MSTPEIVTGWFSVASDAEIFPSGPNHSNAMLCNRNATANVATSITAGDCAQRPEDDPVHEQREHENDGKAEDDAHGDGPAALRGEGERVGTGHHQLSVSEVDEPQDAEDETDADGHERVDRAEADRVGERLPVDAENGDRHAR